jgi:hypothetical protein
MIAECMSMQREAAHCVAPLRNAKKKRTQRVRFVETGRRGARLVSRPAPAVA